MKFLKFVLTIIRGMIADAQESYWQYRVDRAIYSLARGGGEHRRKLNLLPSGEIEVAEQLANAGYVYLEKTATLPALTVVREYESRSFCQPSICDWLFGDKPYRYQAKPIVRGERRISQLVGTAEYLD